MVRNNRFVGDGGEELERLVASAQLMPNSANLTNGTYSMMFIGDPHNNLQGLKMATQVADRLGIEKRICLGDLLLDLSSAYTRDQGLIAEKARAQLRVESPLRAALRDGKYSQAQIDSITNAATASEESVAKHAARTYGIVRDIDPTLRTIGGNWDHETEIKKAFGANYHGTGFTTEDNGMNILWASGGGSAPVGGAGTTRGFLCDNPQEGINRASELGELISKPRGTTQAENEIDMFVTHVPPPQGGQHKDSFAVYLQRFMNARKDVGLPMPKLLVNGHHHRASATLDFMNYQDDETGQEFSQLTFAPGVLALDHQDGAHGAFCVGRFDSVTHELVGASEYHVQRTADGQMRTVLFGEHTVDWDKKEVNFTEIGTVVASEKLEDMFGSKKDLTALDVNYALSEKGFNVNYDGLSAVDLNTQFRQNFSLIREYGEQSKDAVKEVLDTVRNNWDLARAAQGVELSASYTHGELRARQEEVMAGLAIKACKIFGIDPKTLDELSGMKREFHEKMLVKAAFGVNFQHVEEATDNASSKFEDMPYNWGASLLQTANEYVSNAAQQYVLAPINDEQWLDVIDNVWTPLNVERTGTLSRREIYGLVGKALQGGLLSEAEVMATGAYQTNSSFEKGVVMDDAKISDVFGIRYAGDDELGIQKRNGIPASEAAGLQNLIDEKGLPVLRNAKGDYIITKNGAGYLGEDLQTALTYDPIRLSDLLDTGDAELISRGDETLAKVGGAMYPINLEEEGIAAGTYEAKPLWQLMEQQKALRDDKAKEFMRRATEREEFEDDLTQGADLNGANRSDAAYQPNGTNYNPAPVGLGIDMPDLPQ